MNGADALIRTLADNGVEVCFANPGTSEMQFVAALDREPRMRAVLCLFEGVATGAADGYGRMAGKPAATLLHLGPGYLNGGANLHNARRARTPLVSVVGDHATYHRQFDAPLNSDIAALAAPNSKWVVSVETAETVAGLAAEAVARSSAAPSGPVTLILPADSAWTETETLTAAAPPHAPQLAPADRVAATAAAFRQARTPYILLAGSGCRERGLAAAARLEAAGARVFTESFVARQRRGGDIYAPRRLAYFAEAATAELADADLLILVEAAEPVAFFAYPDQSSRVSPEGVAVVVLAAPHEAGDAALEQLADAIAAPAALARAQSAPPGAAASDADLNAHLAAAAIARHLPPGAIVSDDGVTASLPIFEATRDAAPHDWLMLTGGAIGQGLPVAVGAAVACPDRKVVSLNGDGAAMYTVQALWTMARERLDVTVVVFANSAYRILGVEFSRTGSGDRPGPAAARLLDLGDPLIDWVGLAQSLGVSAVRCLSAGDFEAAFCDAMGSPGPRLIEAVTGGAGRRAHGKARAVAAAGA